MENFRVDTIAASVYSPYISMLVSRMGTDQMAVYSLLGTVGGIVGLPVYAYAIAAQTYALQKRASGNKDEAKE